eukprot:1840451-Prymnesium_polylepis.1
MTKTHRRLHNSASFLLVIYTLGCAVSRPRCKMQLSQLYVSARDALGESATRLSQHYLAWGEGFTFAALSPTFGAKVLSQPYSKRLCLRNEPLETQRWNSAQFFADMENWLAGSGHS